MQDTHAVMTYKDEDTGLEFQWHGGEYIDVGYTATEDSRERTSGYPSVPLREAGEFIASECINVWDHAAGEAQIDGFSEFEETCRDWLARGEND